MDIQFCQDMYGVYMVINGEKVYGEEGGNRFHCRHIFIHNGVIYKYDADPDFIQGEGEIEFLSHVSDEDMKFFQPIINSGYRWVAQKFIPTYNQTPKDKWPIIQSIARKYGISPDVNSHKNWCVLPDGQPVIYDYGISPYTKDSY